MIVSRRRLLTNRATTLLRLYGAYFGPPVNIDAIARELEVPCRPLAALTNEARIQRRTLIALDVAMVAMDPKFDERLRARDIERCGANEARIKNAGEQALLATMTLVPLVALETRLVALTNSYVRGGHHVHLLAGLFEVTDLVMELALAELVRHDVDWNAQRLL